MTEKRYKLSRLEAISDGVFAIAMTLLVLDLKLPELPNLTTPEIFRETLHGQLPNVVAWIISFTILCRLWATQHDVLKGGPKVKPSFVTLNFAFLCGISFVPFPTALVSEHGDQPESVIIFSATIMFSGIMIGLLSLVNKRQDMGKLSWKDLDHNAIFALVQLPIIGLIACGLSIWKPVIGSLFWLVLPILGFSSKRANKTT